MAQARRPLLPAWSPWSPLIAAALLGAACSAAPGTPPASPRAAPKPIASAAAPAPPTPDAPLVTWPDPATDPVATGGTPTPPAPTGPVKEPDLEARMLGGATVAEPLRTPSDFRWNEGKLEPRPPRTVTRPPVTVSGRSPAPSAGWGAEVGESFGAGGLGLSGVGEGGGGKGDGSVGLGGVGTIGRGAGTGSGTGFGSGSGRIGGSHKTPDGVAKRVKGPTGSVSVGGVAVSGSGAGAARPPSQESGVRAGEWDDNANFLEFRRYLAREADGVPFHRVDLATRRFLVVRDSAGKPVPNCEVQVEAGGRSLRLLTTSTGRAVLFPHAEGIVAPEALAIARCGDAGQATARFQVDVPDAAVDLKVPGKRQLAPRPTVDIAFVLDTTGSMSEEIDAVKRTVQKVATRLASRSFDVRFALVEYRDRGDDFLVRVHPMTRDARGFAARMSQVRADGGGDMPEDVIEGLRAGLTRVDWSRSSTVRLAFLIGDAPPQLGYGSGSYVDAMRAANRAGIVIHTIAASGMNDLGQAVWRQVAQYTGGTNLFVLRGGAGPQSTGAGDAKSSCGGTHEQFTTGNLDSLIAQKVESAVSALETDAMRIAGLGQDENAKPCAQRISQN
jgi:Mg-chelatase subunit ChlD